LIDPRSKPSSKNRQSNFLTNTFSFVPTVLWNIPYYPIRRRKTNTHKSFIIKKKNIKSINRHFEPSNEFPTPSKLIHETFSNNPLQKKRKNPHQQRFYLFFI